MTPETPQNPGFEPNTPASIEGGAPTSAFTPQPEDSSEAAVIGRIEAEDATGGIPGGWRPEGSSAEQSTDSDSFVAKDGRRRARNSNSSRKSVLNQSPHLEEYLRLMMDENWSSFALERYASYRYGEEISASTFRTKKARIRAQKPADVKPQQLTGKSAKEFDVDHRVDVMKIRNQLAVLQMQRISVDVKTEMDLGKLFSSTKGEIDMLNTLLDRIKADEEDYGIRAKAIEQTQVTVSDLPATVAPKHATLAAALGAGGLDQAQLIKVARELGSIVPINRTREAG